MPDIKDKVFCALRMTESELKRAMSMYDPMHSAHEGYATLLEEIDELWDEVKKSPKNRNIEAMTEEAVQVAAMAIRFIVDVCMQDIPARREDIES